MTLRLPWTFSADDPAGKDLEDRLQENLSRIARQFPLSIANVSQVPQARVYNSAALAIVTATPTALTFNSERWDTAGLHDVAVNTSRLAANLAGLWQITTSLEWAANAVGYRSVAAQLNGATPIAGDTRPAVAGGVVTQQTIATQYRLVAGDYVEVIATQTSGGNLNVTAAGNYTPEFSMHWVSP